MAETTTTTSTPTPAATTTTTLPVATTVPSVCGTNLDIEPDSGELMALDAGTGACAWATRIERGAYVAASARNLFVQHNQPAAVSVFDPTGALLWRAEIGGSVSQAPWMAQSGGLRTLVRYQDGSSAILEADPDGDVTKQAEMEGHWYLRGRRSGIVVLQRDDFRRVQATNEEGDVLWAINLETHPNEAGRILGDYVYFPTPDSYVEVGLETGTSRVVARTDWDFPRVLGRIRGILVVFEASPEDLKGTLTGIDLETGERMWEVRGGAWRFLVRETTVVRPAPGAGLAGYDIETGATRWRLYENDEVLRLTGSSGTTALATLRRQSNIALALFDWETGAHLWRVDVPAYPNVLRVTATSIIVAGESDRGPGGWVESFDLSTGLPLWSTRTTLPAVQILLSGDRLVVLTATAERVSF